MAKYRKKQVIVDAEQWFCLKEMTETVKPFIDNDYRGVDDLCRHCGGYLKFHGFIETLEGGHKVCPGDWIITGVKGEMYPCKPDIFDLTYEKVKDK